MCGRCLGHLVKSDEEIVCVVCGWRSYPIPRRLRLGPRDRAQRRARVRRVALEASARGACHVCGADAVTAKHCRRHQDLNNAAARARLLTRRAARLCRNCELPAVSKRPHQRYPLNPCLAGGRTSRTRAGGCRRRLSPPRADWPSWRLGRVARGRATARKILLFPAIRPKKQDLILRTTPVSGWPYRS